MYPKGTFPEEIDAEVWNNFLSILSCPSPFYFYFVQVLRRAESRLAILKLAL